MKFSPSFSKSHEKSSSLFIILCVAFSTVLMLSNITLKVFYIPGLPNFPMTSGILTYPITFLITDFVSEIWGASRAKFMILLAFCTNLFMMLFIGCVVRLPCHISWIAENNPFGYTTLDEYQNAFSSTFSITSTIFLGSMAAYLVGQLLDVKLFCYLKKKSEGRHLWLRNNVSTCLSQLIDTFIMNGIVLIWGLNFNLSTAGSIMFSEYLYKVIFALLDTPFIYLFVYLFKRSFSNYESIQIN